MLYIPEFPSSLNYKYELFLVRYLSAQLDFIYTATVVSFAAPFSWKATLILTSKPEYKRCVGVHEYR